MTIALVAQLDEHRNSTPEDAGSNPAERAICPICRKSFADRAAMRMHIINKPGHIEGWDIEMQAMRTEIEVLREAVTAWRSLARERAR